MKAACRAVGMGCGDIAQREVQPVSLGGRVVGLAARW